MSRSVGARGRQIAALALVGVLLLSVGTSVVAAQSFQGAAGTVVVEEGETYDSIDGVAGSIVVYGTVTGDVSGAAGDVHVAESGRVEGSIEAAAGAIRIDGTVMGDVSVGGGRVSVSEPAHIGGDLDVGAGYLSVDGRIDGNVHAGAETIVLGPNADVGGEFRYDADNFTRDPEATVGGGVVQDSDLRGSTGGIGDAFSVPGWLVTIYGLLANLLLGVILLAAFPSFSSGVASRVADEPIKSGGVGLLSLIGVPIALALIAITIVGIPFAIVGAIAFGAALWVGVVYGQYAVGAWVLGLAGADNRWLALFVGLVGFAILGMIPILGGLLELVALLLGLGALALGLHAGYRGRREREARSRETPLEDAAGDVSEPPTSSEQE